MNRWSAMADERERKLHKRCNKCGDLKPLDEFHNNASRKDGKQAWCKPCNRAYSKATYYRNKEERENGNC